MRRTLPAAVLALISAVAQANTPPPARVVQVTGNGEATGQPDRAQLSMSVEARNLELRVAEAKVNEVVRAYLQEAKGLGATEADLSTASYSVNAEYDWVDNKQVFRGYRAVRQIAVKVKDLNKVGDYLLRATKVGINQVNPPVLESSKQKDIERAALKNAALDAKAQAAVVAEALGVRVGAPRTVNANAQGFQPPMPMPKMAMMRADAAEASPSGNEQMGFSGGEIRASANVTVEFGLLP